MATITWLHFADLHISTSNNNEIGPILNTLWGDLKYLATGGLKPDFIAFTGDVTASGKPEEYTLAMKLFFDPLLETTQLPKERLFIVPGNHDVERDKVDRYVARGMANLLNDRDAINQFLSPEQDRTFLFQKFNSYSNFINNYLGGHLGFDPQRYCYGYTFELNGVLIGVLGLNSAWMSATFRDTSGQITDQGHLLIGERQLDTVLGQVAQTDLRLALMHHPFDWLHESERTRIKRHLSAECHFILHGHLHEPEVEILHTLSESSVFIPAGALYYHRDYSNAYNVVRFDTNTGKGTIHLRRYVDAGPKGPIWIKDLRSSGDDLDGRVHFRLLNAAVPQTKPDELKRPARVLHVEDQESWHRVVQSILFPPDFDLQHVTSTVEAKKRLTEESFDLLLLNLCLTSDYDYLGVTLLDWLSKQDSPYKIPCIVLTGSPSPVRGLYERYGIFEVFIKGQRDSFNAQSVSYQKNGGITAQPRNPPDAELAPFERSIRLRVE